jgi:hypothetical protein
MLLGVLGTLLLSSKVWMTERNFPVIPLFDGIPSMPPPLDYILYSILIVMTIYQIIYLENRNTMYALVGMYAFLMLGDQMRWQPYNVHYLLMMIGLLFYPARIDQLLQVFRCMIVAFYIWSGLQELNAVFIESIFPWLAAPLAEKFPAAMEEYVLGGGYVFPFLNILTGVGLLFQKTRNLSVYMGILIQFFLFYALSPMGLDWNVAILPYHAVLAFFTFSLFYDSEFSLRNLFWSNFRYQQGIVVFYCVLPVLSFFGIYDKMQSFNIYSGKAYYGKIYISEQLHERLPDGWKRYVFTPPRSRPFIETTYWSMDALKVSPYSEIRIYKALEREICKRAEGDCGADLDIYTYEDQAED